MGNYYGKKMNKAEEDHDHELQFASIEDNELTKKLFYTFP